MVQTTLADVRRQYPQYDDLTDQQLADAIYQQHYSDMPRADFDQRVGLSDYWSGQFEQATGATALQARPVDSRTNQQRAESYVRSRRDGGGVASPASFLATGMQEAFNLSDEGAALGARISNFYDNQFGGDRRPDLDPRAVAQAERDRLTQAREDQPLSQGARELFASLPAAAVGGTGVRGAVAGGAAMGSLAGYGAGETPEERATGAMVGGGIGAAVGGGAAALSQQMGRAASPLVRAIQRRLSGDGGNMTRAQRRAFAELRQAFREEGMTGRQVMDALRRYQDSGFDDATLMDAASPGGPVQRLVRAAGTRGGEAGRELEGLLEDRLNTQADRVGQRLSRYLSRVDNLSDEAAQLVRARSERAAPLYRAAYGPDDAPNTLAREQVAAILQRTSRRDQALARRLAQRAGRSVSFDGDGPVSVEDMHYLKLALDDQIRSLGPVERRSVVQLKADLMAAMPDEYRQAANAFAGDSALIDALDAGSRAMRGDAEAVESLVSGMTDGERQMFRAGLVRAARELVERTQDGGDVVRRVIGNEDRRRRLAAAFDSPAEFERFVEALRGEQARVRNARFSAPGTGSQTQMRGVDVEREATGTLGDLIRGDLLGAVSRIGYVGRDAARQAQRRATDAEIVRIATAVQRAASPEARQLLLDQAAQEYGEEVAQQITEVLTRGAVPAAVVTANTTTP